MTSHLPSPESMSTVKEEKDSKKIITAKKEKAKEKKGITAKKEKAKEKKGITAKKEKAKEKKGDDYDDDCYEIDPIDFARKLTLKVSDEVVLVSEKGPVALRDFPHPRHLCANFPFDTSPHKSYCSQCFCYVCEVAAPCKQWKGTDGHCNVSKK